MKVDYIALSIPIFFMLIGIELLISYFSKKELYRFNDSITNISLGIGQQVTGLFMKTALFFGYLYLYTHYRQFTVSSNLLNWVILFFAVDFFYYWFHRLSHEVNAMWAAHIVHHQSEEYNLSVALRQSWFQSAFSWVFYLPLAVLGFDPVMFLTLSAFNTLYQFWIHTRAINKLGFLELFLNTPSHHRVHHGSNPKYIDKNHAGTLIIWDKMFGTFQAEEEEPVYGITKPLASWNPLWANFHYWAELWKLSKESKSIKDKLLVFLKTPGWKPLYLGGREYPVEVDKINYKKYDKHPHQKAWNYYVLFLFISCLALSTILLFEQSKLNVYELIFASGFSLFTLLVCGGFLENKSWVRRAEMIRIASMIVGCLLFYKQVYFLQIVQIVTVWTLLNTFYFLYLLRYKGKLIKE
jgi:alkylglycerol monooxygenase